MDGVAEAGGAFRFNHHTGPTHGDSAERLDEITYDMSHNDRARKMQKRAKRPSPYDECLRDILAFAKERGLRKADGRVYQPVDGCPCGFVRLPYRSYLDFVNEVLRDKLLQSPRLPGDLVRTLDKLTEVVDFPEYRVTSGLWSFRDGVFNGLDMQFHRYGFLPTELQQAAAVHHFDFDYPGELAAGLDYESRFPVFSSIIKRQLPDPDTRRLFYVMMGKSLLPVKSKERWESFTYVYGVAGTGKTTAVEALNRLQPCHSDLPDTPDGRFSLADMLDKELITTVDCDPMLLKRVLPATTVNNMCEGKAVSINRKNSKTVTVDPWRAPLFIASGDTWRWSQDSIAHRVVAFFFQHAVGESERTVNFDTDIVPELPFLLVALLRAHHDMAMAHGQRDAPPLTPEAEQWRANGVGVGRPRPVRFI